MCDCVISVPLLYSCIILFLSVRIVFGMSKDSFRRILEIIQDDLAGEREEDNPVDLLPIHKFSIFLQFLRTNSFHKSVGSQHHIRVAASAACKNINSVAKILSRLVPKVIYFFSKSSVQSIKGFIDFVACVLCCNILIHVMIFSLRIDPNFAALS
jgi:hypothetical protein